MTANRLPVTQEYLKEFMTEFMPRVLQPIYTRLDGIDAKLVDVKAELGEHGQRLNSIDTTLAKVQGKLEEHDDLLETIAAEVSHDQDEIHEFAGARRDHEKRITHLERGFMKYMINS